MQKCLPTQVSPSPGRYLGVRASGEETPLLPLPPFAWLVRFMPVVEKGRQVDASEVPALEKRGTECKSKNFPAFF